jgi:hypothetical protein
MRFWLVGVTRAHNLSSFNKVRSDVRDVYGRSPEIPHSVELLKNEERLYSPMDGVRRFRTMRNK